MDFFRASDFNYITKYKNSPYVIGLTISIELIKSFPNIFKSSLTTSKSTDNVIKPSLFQMGLA